MCGNIDLGIEKSTIKDKKGRLVPCVSECASASGGSCGAEDNFIVLLLAKLGHQSWKLDLGKQYEQVKHAGT